MKAVCPACKKQTSFKFEGYQEIPGYAQHLFNEEALELWTCAKCGTTRTKGSILNETH